MPALLLHAAAIQRLADTAPELPPELARALGEDLEYARLGAFLPDLPWFDGLGAGAALLGRGEQVPPFAALFHDRAPVALGLKMAELVALGALVGKEAGRAFVTGYFAHLCLDRALRPETDALVKEHRVRGETVPAARRRIEWTQALFYLRQLHGRPVLGDPLLRRALRVSKTSAFPREMGKGFYELVRLSAEAALAEAPLKPQVDRWVRGLGAYALLLSTPVGRMRELPSYAVLTERELFRGDGVDFPASVERALTRTRQVLSQLDRFIARGSFTPRTRQRFLEGFPEGAVGTCVV